MDMSPNFKLNLFPDDKPSFIPFPRGQGISPYLGLIWNPMD